MLISHDYIYLYTSKKQALQILYILKKYCNNNFVLVDANAGMGGNSIFFCNYFKFVYCIDISELAINYLNHNLKDYDNKYIVNDNCLDILKIISYDVIFFDPPWGGSNYKFKKTLNLYINNIDFYTIIDNLYYYKNLKIICLKAPNNFLIKKDIKWKYYIHNIYKSDNKSILFKFIIYKK